MNNNYGIPLGPNMNFNQKKIAQFGEDSLRYDGWRRTTSYHAASMDDSYVYASIELAIPKRFLNLDDAQAVEDEKEFGNCGVEFTLNERLGSYLQKHHNAFINSTKWLVCHDARSMMKLNSKKNSDTKPKHTSIDEVLAEETRLVVIVSKDPDARFSFIERVSQTYGRASVVVNLELHKNKAHPSLDFALSPLHARHCVTYITGLEGKFTNPKESDHSPAGEETLKQVMNTINKMDEDAVIFLGYHSSCDVPDEIKQHPDARILLPDNVGCTEFGAGYQGRAA